MATLPAPERGFPPAPIEAITGPLRAVPYLLTRPRLLGLALLPVLINIAIFALVASLGWSLTPDIAGSDTESAFWGFLGSLAEYALLVVVLLLAGLISFLLVIPLAAPFIDLISEYVEHETLRTRPELIVPSPTILAGMRHALLEGLRRVAVQLPIAVTIFIIGLIPCLGAPVAAVLAFVNAAIFLPLDALSYSMDRRGMSLRQKLDFLRANRRFWFSFGAGLAVLFLIPCSILWFPTLAGVAATRFYCRALKHGQAGGTSEVQRLTSTP